MALSQIKGVGFVSGHASGDFRAKFFLFIGNQKGKAGLERVNRKLEEMVRKLSEERLSFEVTADEWQISFRCSDPEAARERVRLLCILAASMEVKIV